MAACSSPKVGIVSHVPDMPAIADVGALGALFDIAPIPMLLAHARSSRIIRANGAAVRAYGWSEAELVGMTVGDLEVDATRGDAATRRHRRRNGSDFQVDVVTTSLRVAGDELHLLLMRDNTEFARALRSEFAARLHDGPVQVLTGVVLHLGLLRGEVPQDAQATLAEMENLVRDALDSVRATIEDHA
jgi:signal transduction histidine kinase